MQKEPHHNDVTPNNSCRTYVSLCSSILNYLYILTKSTNIIQVKYFMYAKNTYAQIISYKKL